MILTKSNPTIHLKSPSTLILILIFILIRTYVSPSHQPPLLSQQITQHLRHRPRTLLLRRLFPIYVSDFAHWTVKLGMVEEIGRAREEARRGVGRVVEAVFGLGEDEEVAVFWMALMSTKECKNKKRRKVSRNGVLRR